VTVDAIGGLDTFEEVLDALRHIFANGTPHATLVVDTLDQLEALIIKYVCKKNGWASIETPSYGKGFVEVETEVRRFIAAICAIRDKHGMAVMMSNPQAIQSLGAPVKAGRLVSGNINTTDSSGDADLSIPVRGSLRSGKLYVIAKKSVGVWHYEKIQLWIDGQSSGLDLLHDRLRRSTMLTLIVTIFNERDRGVVATLNMVTRTDGNFEPGHLFSPARVRRPVHRECRRHRDRSQSSCRTCGSPA